MPWNRGARDSRSFDAAFHHYAEGVDSAYPITRTLRLAVAFEAFVNLVTQDFAKNEPIMDDDFEAVRKVLYSCLEGQRKPGGPLTDVQHQRLRSKIENLNSASNTRRLRSFWEKVPIPQSEADDSLLRRLRSYSVHRGYVGEDLTPEGLLPHLRTRTDSPNVRICAVSERYCRRRSRAALPAKLKTVARYATTSRYVQFIITSIRGCIDAISQVIQKCDFRLQTSTPRFVPFDQRDLLAVECA